MEAIESHARIRAQHASSARTGTSQSSACQLVHQRARGQSDVHTEVCEGRALCIFCSPRQPAGRVPGGHDRGTTGHTELEASS